MVALTLCEAAGSPFDIICGAAGVCLCVWGNNAAETSRRRRGRVHAGLLISERSRRGIARARGRLRLQTLMILLQILSGLASYECSQLLTFASHFFT